MPTPDPEPELAPARAKSKPGGPRRPDAMCAAARGLMTARRGAPLLAAPPCLGKPMAPWSSSPLDWVNPDTSLSIEDDRPRMRRTGCTTWEGCCESIGILNVADAGSRDGFEGAEVTGHMEPGGMWEVVVAGHTAGAALYGTPLYELSS